jgi:hypothetical protein
MSKIRSNTAHDITTLGGQTPETVMGGETADISELCEYDWFQWLWFRDTLAHFPDESRVLVRYMGPAKSIGPAMCCHILKANGSVLQRSTVGPLTPEELSNEDMKRKMEEYMSAIYSGPLGPVSTDDDFSEDSESTTPTYDSYDDDQGDKPKMPEADTFTVDAFDKYIGAQLRMPLNDMMTEAKVVGRVKDASGNPVGVSHANPLQDTRVYEVKFPDGTMAEYGANLIATAMFAQVDYEGRSYNIMDEIVDHRKSGEAMPEDEEFVTIRGKRHPVRTTKGWEMCILWKTGDTSWEKLKDMKEANPIKAAEYPIAKGLGDEPAFNWWAKHALKKRDSIISTVRARFIRRDYKFGIKVPANIAEARALDAENRDDTWECSVEKEMKNVRVAFKILDDGQAIPVGYQRLPCMLIFDLRILQGRHAWWQEATSHNPQQY